MTLCVAWIFFVGTRHSKKKFNVTLILTPAHSESQQIKVYCEFLTLENI